MKKSLRKIIAAICMGTMLLSCTAYGADSSQNLMAYTDNVLSDGSLIYYFEEVAVTLPADWQGKSRSRQPIILPPFITRQAMRNGRKNMGRRVESCLPYPVLSITIFKSFRTLPILALVISL